MSARRLTVLVLISLVVLPACAPRHAAPATLPPTATPTAVVPGAPPSPAATVPAGPATPSLPSTPAVASPSLGPLPTVLAEIDLGVQFERTLQHAVALDVDGRRIFVGAPPDRTLVLSAESLQITDTLSFGGDLALDRTRGRLFIGAPGGVAVFDLDSLQLAGAIPITVSLLGSTPIVDETTGMLLVVNNGIYTADATSLRITGRISGTFPSPGGIPSNAYAVDAALDTQRRWLYISLNNGIPGSNNGNTLLVQRLGSGDTIYQDSERSIVSLEVEEATGRLFVTRSRMDSSSLSILAAQDSRLQPELQINGVLGSVQVDTRRGRIYVADSGGIDPRLLVLDSVTGALVADVPLPGAYTLAALDAQADRLYLLSPAGRLLVMSGHGATTPAAQKLEQTDVMTGSVAWIAPSPDYANDQTLFAAWTPDQTASGPLGSLAGQLAVSADGGATWRRVHVRGQTLASSWLWANALAYSPDFARDRTMFAAFMSSSGRGGGIYVSNDGGRTWKPATSGLGDWVVAEIAAAPGFPVNHTVFALTRQGGLFRSTDGGQTWQRTGYNPAYPAVLNAHTLAISPDYINDKTVVVSVGESASISRDGGDNWWPLLESRATVLAFSPHYSRDRVLLGAFASLGVLRSDDGGANWQAVSRGLRLEVGGRLALALSPDFGRDRTAFLLSRSFDRSTLYRTADGGATWQIESAGATGKALITAIAISPDFARDGMVFWGGNDGRIRTVKAGDLRWSNAPAELDKLNVESIAVSPGYAVDRTIFIGGGRTGVFVSTDGATSWQETNFPARDVGLGRIRIALSPGYAEDRIVFASAGGQVFRSNDGGATWQPLSSGLGSFFPVANLALSPKFTQDSTVLLGGEYRTPRVMRSTNAGQAWITASGLAAGTNGILALAFVPGDGRVAYAWADQAGLHRSGDGGATWTRIYSPTETSSTGLGWLAQSLAISPDFLHDRLMFAGFVGAQNLRRSADGGATWRPADAGLPAGLIWGSAIALSPDWARERLIFLGTDKGVFRSEDGGLTWKASSVGLPQSEGGRPVGVLSLAISPDWASDRTVFAGLAERGLYVSNDGGATWKPAR